MPRPLPDKPTPDFPRPASSPPHDLASHPDLPAQQISQPLPRRRQFGESEHGHPRQFGEHECGWP
jgi:hypothetical protein|nr:hypothetical protein [Panacagrimonas sp.]